MLGTLARLGDRILVRIPSVLMPFWLAEVLARSGGVLVSWVSSLDRQGAESRVRGLLWGVKLKATGLRVGRCVEVHPLDRIELGADVALHRGVALDASGERGRITIGEGSHVDRNSVLYGQGGIRIGSGCAIAAGILVYSQTNRFDLAPLSPILEQGTHYEEVTIGDDVWIGAGAVILPGSRIGDHAVVAAGAVVRGEVPPWQVVGGVPARALKDRRG